MFRSCLPRRGLPAPAARMLRAVPRPAGLAVAAVTAAGLAAVVPALPASAASGSCAASSGQVTCTFDYTGSAQTWTVPAGVTTATFDLSGAQGGGTGYFPAQGGLGGETTATLSALPAGGSVQVNVGGQGGFGSGAGSGVGGGFNGGGNTCFGYGGGGASDIRIGGTGLADRLLVAGGGGGTDGTSVNGANAAGGAGGGLSGDPGLTGGVGAAEVGGGGTQSGGGTATAPASPGTLGMGGAGPLESGNSCYAGAGGGGGWYGGGGGYEAGGGGGSGYISPRATGGSTQTGVNSGNGLVTITYNTPVITGLNPDRGPSFGFTPVLITGTGLACPAGDRSCKVTVTFGGRRALVVRVRPDEIVVLSPPGSGTVTVTVTVGAVSSQATAATTFTYLRFL
jgi:hypothetical protein